MSMQYVYIKNNEIVSHTLIPIGVEHDRIEIVEVDDEKSYVLRITNDTVFVDYVKTEVE